MQGTFTPATAKAANATSAQVRGARSRLRGKMLTSELTLKQALENTIVQHTAIYDLLLYVPGIGPRAASRTLERLRIGEKREVRQLTVRQRAELVTEIARERDPR